MSKIIEKERKWLLKRIPDNILSIQYYIEQFYTPDGWRYRFQRNLNDGSLTYVKLRKEAIGVGINHEIDITDITAEEYSKVIEEQSPLKVIRKYREIIEHNGKKLEIDAFIDITICMLEIEDVELDDEIDFPEYIKNEIIKEVTGDRAFSNQNLAILEDIEDTVSDEL